MGYLFICSNHNTNRQDVEFRYSNDADAVKIYMTRTTPGLIAESVPLDYDEADLFMDVDDQDRVVAIEFLDASQIFACHFFDGALTLDDKEYPPCPWWCCWSLLVLTTPASQQATLHALLVRSIE
nr:hypothetical protein [Pandoravirus massiliensis]